MRITTWIYIGCIVLGALFVIKVASFVQAVISAY